MSDQLTQFDYLLNAFELASQQEQPAQHGYGDKRKALFAHVRDLERRASLPTEPATAATVPVARKKLCTCYGDGTGRGGTQRCPVKAGQRLGDGWQCADELAASRQAPAEPLDGSDS